ncbi:MAG: DUF2442 domain-containing protein [Planctomycetes bacterium]|nr:DUF2442 domain-containing protein [Planctomycetota bacterium]
MNPRIKSVEPTSDYKLKVYFSNREIGIFDVTPYLGIGVFKELTDRNYFNQAKVFDGTVVWPHEQDFCPDTIYNESIRHIESG